MAVGAPWVLSQVQVVAEAVATAAFALSGIIEGARKRPDAIGLGLFTASGAQIALDSGMPAIVAVLLCMVTAVFGGVLRDVVCNEIPRAFHDHRPYAICAFAGGWLLVAAQSAGLQGWVSLTLAALVALRLERGPGTVSAGPAG